MKKFVIVLLIIVKGLISCEQDEKSRLLKQPLLKQAHENNSLRIQPVELTDHERQELLLALEEQNNEYDPREQMLKSEFSSPGYHTTLTGGEVHRTRESLRYAVSLLDTYDEEFRERAIQVIDRVIGLQETDPDNEYFGIWPWFMEEPIDQMAPPDRNWADFCGAQLLEITLTHRHRLPDSLNQKIDQSLQYASQAIRKRDVGPGYTNIAIMGTFVTYVTSVLYELEELNQYARQRLERFYEFTKHHNGFTEYNSPTYTRVALDELSRMRKYIVDPEMKPKIDELYHTGWDIFANHFHAPTRQLAGPHSRCYRTIDKERLWGFIQDASGGEIAWGYFPSGPYDHRLVHQIPTDLISEFQNLEGARTEKSIFYNDEPRKIGITYLDPDYTLGTINRSNFWNQRRNLLAYWGNPSDVKFLNLRFLHDGYDFSAVQFFGLQQNDKVIVASNIATNGGDTHISLDRIKNATFEADELKLRFELGNVALENLSLPDSYNEPVEIAVDDLYINVYVPYVAFVDYEPKWELSYEEGNSYLELVIYEGDRRTFDLNEIQKAVLGLGLSMDTESADMEELVSYRIGDIGFFIQMDEMEIAIPFKPAEEDDLQDVKTEDNSIIHASLSQEAFQ